MGWISSSTRFSLGLYGRFPLACETIASMIACLLYIGPIVFPLIRVPYPGGDTFQMVWNLFSVAESLLHGLNPLRSEMIFWPEGGNLTTHSLASGFAPLVLAVRAVVGDGALYPMVAFNLAVLTSFLATMLFTLAALRRLGFSLSVAVVPALCATFASFYGLHIAHLNLLSAFVVPLGFLLIHGVLTQPGPGRAVLAAACLGWALYLTEMAVFLYVLLAVCMAVFPPVRHRLVTALRQLGPGWTLVAAAVFAAITAPFILTWTSSDALRPQAGDSSLFSANLLGFVVPGHFRAPLYGDGFAGWNARMSGIGGFEAFLGYPFLILVGIGVTAAWRNPAVRYAVLLAVVFLVLSLGPTLKVNTTDTGIPLPYGVLMQLPPFSMGRTPVRLIIFALFMLTVPAAAGMRALLAGTAPLRLAVAGALALWAMVEVRYPPVPRGPLPGLDGAERLEGPVLVLPLRINNGRAMAMQIIHRQPMSAGYLARLTQRQIDLFHEQEQIFAAGPRAMCGYARAAGFRSILVTAPLEDGYDEGLAVCPVPVYHSQFPASDHGQRHE